MNKKEYIAKLEGGKVIAEAIREGMRPSTRELRTAIVLWRYGQECAGAIRHICAPVMCRSCTRCCCYSPSGYWRLSHWILYLLDNWHMEDMPLPMPSSLQAQDMGGRRGKLCQFLNPDKGCTIPSLARPRICAQFSCHSWESHFKRIGCGKWFATSQSLIRETLGTAQNTIESVLKKYGGDTNLFIGDKP